MQVNFDRRDLSGALSLAEVGLEVERLEWRALGGPWSARVIARAANLQRLWRLVELLRCGMTVSDDGGAGWWGYVSAVELHIGALVLRLDLADVWNRIMVRYRDESPNSAGGEQHYSAWVIDSKSCSQWGYRYKVFDMGQGSAGDAAAYARSLIKIHGRPRIKSSLELAARAEDFYAVLEGAGWWETLDWKYYSQVRGQAGTLTGGTMYNIGMLAQQRITQGFISAGAAWNAGEIWVKVRRYLSVDTLTLRIYSASNGGSLLATGSLSGSLIEDEFKWVKWVFDTPVVVDATPKFIYIMRSGSASDGSYFNIAVDESLSYTGGALLVYNGSNWVTRAPDADLCFLLTGTEDTATQIKDMVVDGQFFDTCRLLAASGVEGRLFRDGSLRNRDEVELLLRAGNSDGTEYLAQVDRGRLVKITLKPEVNEIRYSIGADGTIYRLDGRAALGSDQPGGCWAGFGDAGAVGSLLGYESGYFLERVVWEGGKLRAGL